MRQILAPLRLQIFQRDAQQTVIDIVSAQMGIAVSRQHFEDPVVQLQNRDIERAAAQVINGNDAFLPLIETIGQRGAVGSFTSRKTSSPAMRPASRVACLWRR